MKYLLLFSFTIFFINTNLFAQFPEGFESGVPPTGWVSFIGSNGLGTSQSWEDNTDANGGSQAAFIRYENVSGGDAEDWLVTPQFTPANLANQLEFYEKQAYSSDYGTTFSVKVSTGSQNNYNDFVDLVTYTEADFSMTYTKRTVDLSAYDGQQIYVAFVMYNDDGDNWYIDDVDLPATLPPLNYTLTTSGGSYESEKWVNITTGVDGTGTVVWAQGNGTIGNLAGFLTNEVIDLSNYQGANLYINTYDKYGDSWDGSIYTLNDPNGNLVINNGNITPDDFQDNDPTSSWSGTPAELEISEVFTVLTTGPTCLPVTNVSGSNPTNTTYDISWTVGGTETEWDIEFGPTGFVQGSGSGTLLQNVTTNTGTLSGLTQITTYDYYVRAYCSAGSVSTWSAVNSFTTLATCPAVSNVSGSNPTINTYDISWTVGGSETAWEIEFGPTGYVQGSGTLIQNVTTNTGTLSGLTQNTVYDYYIRANCGSGDFSDWSAVNSFTTLISCPAILQSSISSSNIQYDEADISWAANGSETDWNIEYHTSSFTPGSGTGTTITANSNTNFQLSGLAGNTTYYVYIQANCGGGDLSFWSATSFTFTTAPPPSLNYTLTTTGGSFASEKWVNITTGVDGTGTVVWAQGNGTIGNGSGLLTDEVIDLYNNQGANLYINAYDQYDDSWDGTTYTLKDPDGNVVVNNNNVTPDDILDVDATNGWDSSSDELESSELFTVLSTSPTINTGLTTQITGLLTCQVGGAASQAQSFTVTGSALTNAVVLTCGSDFEMSSDGGSNYLNSLNLPISGTGTVVSTIDVRLKGGLSQGSYQDQISISSPGATAQSVSLSGASIPSQVYVTTSGNDATGDGSQASPYKTLSFAFNTIQAVSCGASTVHLGAGTFTDTDLSVTNDDITIIGAGVNSTILDGVNQLNRLMTIDASNFSMSDLKVQNYGLDYSTCSSSGDCNGGAICVGDGISTLTSIGFDGVHFYNNQNDGSSGSGGAVYVNVATTVTFDKCEFSDNSAGASTTSASNAINNGGAVCVEGIAFMNNCLFYKNISKGYGSAVYVYGSSAEADLKHCTVSENTARGNYGALAVRLGQLEVYNSIAYNNRFSSSNSLGNDFYEGSGLLIGSYSCYRDDYFNRSNLSNCITTDPLFADASNNDFSLQTSSLAIDAGLAAYSLSTDITGLARPQGPGYDMGSYEYSFCNTASVSSNVVENCNAGTFTVEATVSSYGDGTSVNLTDGTTTVTNASLNTVYSFGPYSTSTTVTVQYNGDSYGGCDGNSGLLGGCAPNICVDAIDLSAGNVVADFSLANNDNLETDSGTEPNFLQVGNGTTIASCASGITNNAYDYTDYKDLWYKVVVPAGDDEFTLTFSNVTGHYMVLPYYGTCGNLTQMRLLYNVDQSITGVIDANGDNWFGDDPFVTPSITTLDFKGDEILNAPGGVVYLRVFPYDGGLGGSAGCQASNLSTASITINSSIQPPATRYSISDGNWSDPSTWDCNCTPAAADNIVVDHLVDVNASITVSNTLTVNNSGTINIVSPNSFDVDGGLDNSGAINGIMTIGGSSDLSITLGTVEVVVINTSATITLTADASVTERLTLSSGTLNTGAYKLTLESDANSTALIEDLGGIFAGTVEAERYIQNTTGHHFLSAPVYSPTIGQFNDDVALSLQGSAYPTIYYYDETDPSLDYEVGWLAPTSLSHTMNEGEGYTVHFNASAGVTLDIEGSPITGSVSRGLTYTAGSNPPNNATSPQGWNFVGNPYPSPIDFDLLMTNAPSIIQRSYYTWDPSNKSYNSYVGGIGSPATFNQNIHSMQGFWVRVDAASSITFDNSCRLNDPNVMTTPFLKSAFTAPIVRLSIEGSSSVCETVVAFRGQATKNFDNEYDAHFLKSEQANRVDFASDVNGTMLRINSLEDDFSKNIAIPLMNKVSLDSIYSIKLTEFENFPAHAELYIEDKSLNLFYPIGNDAYYFNSNPSDRNDRFVLHVVVNGTINVDKLSDNNDPVVDAYKCNDNLCLEIEQAVPHAFDLLMYDKNGRLVVQRTLDAGLEQYSIEGISQLNTDIYVVSIPELGFNKTIKW
jgi:hypothetical protein